MICPVCEAKLVLVGAKQGVDPSVACTESTCNFEYAEKLVEYEHVCDWEMNFATRHACKAAAAEAALAQKFNFRQVFS